MAIEAKCDHCGVTNFVEDKLDGKFTVCTGCRSPFRVVAAGESPVESESVDPSENKIDAMIERLTIKDDEQAESESSAGDNLKWDLPKDFPPNPTSDNDDLTLVEDESPDPPPEPKPEPTPQAPVVPLMAVVVQPPTPVLPAQVIVPPQGLQPIVPTTAQSLQPTSAVPPPKPVIPQTTQLSGNRSGNGLWIFLSFATLGLAAFVGYQILVVTSKQADPEEVADASQNQISNENTAVDLPDTENDDPSDNAETGDQNIADADDAAPESESSENTTTTDETDPTDTNTNEPDNTESPFKEVDVIPTSDTPPASSDNIPSDPPETEIVDTQVPWQVPLDRRPRSPGKLLRGVIRFDPGEIGNVRFSNARVGQAVVHLYDASSQEPRYVMRRIDLSDESVLNEIEVADKTRLVDFSMDGRTILTKSAASSSVQVWSCSDDSHRQTTTIRVDGQADLSTAMVVTRDDVVLINNTTSELVGWNIPQNAPSYSIPWSNRESSFVSWNRSFVISWKKNEVTPSRCFEVFDLRTGKQIGKTDDFSDPINSVAGGTLTIDGGSFVATLNVAGQYIVTLWDMRTGELLEQFDVPKIEGYHQMIGGRYVLAGKSLIDIRFHALVWNYPSLEIIPGSFNDSAWFVGGKDVPLLINRKVPSDKIDALIGAVAQQRRTTKDEGFEPIVNKGWAGFQGIGSSELTTGGEKVTLDPAFKSFGEK